jgi:hypothetical protein
MDIIILTICAVISGAEGWEAIEQFGNENKRGCVVDRLGKRDTLT